MYDENIETIYHNIITKDLPDKDIEIFWYSWKNAIQNAFRHKKDILKLFKLNEYSHNLNSLQAINDYIGIQQIIQTYLERHVIISIENYIDSYNCNILDTHLKRWSKLTKKSSKLDKRVIRNSNYNFKLFTLYLIILNDKTIDNKKLNPNNNKKLSDKEVLLDHVIGYRFKDIIEYVVENKKASILDKMLLIEDQSEYISLKYNTTYYKGTKGHKILKKIYSNNKHLEN